MEGEFGSGGLQILRSRSLRTRIRNPHFTSCSLPAPAGRSTSVGSKGRASGPAEFAASGPVGPATVASTRRSTAHTACGAGGHSHQQRSGPPGRFARHNSVIKVAPTQITSTGGTTSQAVQPAVRRVDVAHVGANSSGVRKHLCKGEEVPALLPDPPRRPASRERLYAGPARRAAYGRPLAGPFSPRRM